MQNRISIFSFFSGIGILDLAFERNGYNIVFVNEYDSFFLESYQYARTQMNQRDPLYGYHNDSAERTITMIVRNAMQDDVEKEISLPLLRRSAKKET